VDADKEVAAGLRLFSVKKYAQAEQLFRDIVAHHPRHAGALNGFGMALLQLYRLEEAEGALSAAVAAEPNFAAARFNLGWTCMEAGDTARGISHLEKALEISPRTARFASGLASACERCGEFDKATAYFAQASALSPKFRIASTLRFDRAFFEEISAARPLRAQPAVLFESTNDAAPRSVVLASCDEHYFNKYGAAYFSSFACHADLDCGLHLHALDPEPRFVSAVIALVEELGISPFVMTGESAPRFEADLPDRKSWGGCGRYAHLAAWLDHYDVPVLVTDIDEVIDGSIGPLIESVEGRDMGLLMRRPRLSPWFDVIAYAVVAMPTRGSRDYLRRVSAYIALTEREHGLFWCQDQASLYCTLRLLQTYGVPPSIQWINDAVRDVVYHVGHGYDEQMADRRYAKYRTAPP
jgi:tetratricopeptide (TPR) repeat protein